jgi:hypothetical protein
VCTDEAGAPEKNCPIDKIVMGTARQIRMISSPKRQMFYVAPTLVCALIVMTITGPALTVVRTAVTSPAAP